MSKRAFFLAAVFALLLVSGAFADSMVFVAPPGNPPANPVVVLPGEPSNTDPAIWASWYVSPYYGQDFSRTGNPILALFCIDFNHTVYKPEPWTANITNFSDIAVNQTLYYEAAWIFENTWAGKNYGRALAQVAVWDLFVNVLTPPNKAVDLANAIPVGSTPSPAVTTGSVAQVKSDAASHTTQAGLALTWTLVHDTNAASDHVQWFITPNYPSTPPDSNVPEPAAILLMGVVLVGCGKHLARHCQPQ